MILRSPLLVPIWSVPICVNCCAISPLEQQKFRIGSFHKVPCFITVQYDQPIITSNVREKFLLVKSFLGEIIDLFHIVTSFDLSEFVLFEVDVPPRYLKLLTRSRCWAFLALYPFFYLPVTHMSVFFASLIFRPIFFILHEVGKMTLIPLLYFCQLCQYRQWK